MCIFCGAPADSREHLLPNWLGSIFPSDEPAVHFREVGGVKKSWQRARFDEKTKVVCKECNEGWMSQLEQFAKPILAGPISRGGACALDLRAQWIAAQWAAKTSYVFQTLAPEGLAPMTHPVLLRLNGEPPPGVSVFIGSHYRAVQDPANCFYLQRPLSMAYGHGTEKVVVDEFGYLSWLAVGGVSFLVLGHRTGRYVEMILGEHMSGAFEKIWPLSSRLARWPPELMMDRELIEPSFLDHHPPAVEIRMFDLPLHADAPR